MDKIVGNVYESYDYSKFRKLIGNRNVKHVKGIIESVKDVGRLEIPIIVNEKFEIIDGQNRFDAFVQLGMSIIYRICEGYGIKECVKMNSISVNWGLEDYINCYAEYGYEDFIILRKFENEYSGKLPKAVIRQVAAGKIASIPNKEIRNGTFKCGYSESKIKDILEFLSEFDIPKTIRGNSKLLYRVFRFCYESELVDNTRLYKQWNEQASQIQGITDIKSAAEAVEKIYNFHKKSGYVFIATEYRKVAEMKCAGALGGGKSGWDIEESDENEMA